MATTIVSTVYPQDVFDPEVSGAPVITRAGVAVDNTKLAAVQAAAAGANVTLALWGAGATAAPSDPVTVPGATISYAGPPTSGSFTPGQPVTDVNGAIWIAKGTTAAAGFNAPGNGTSGAVVATTGTSTGDQTFQLVLAGTSAGGVLGMAGTGSPYDSTPHLNIQSWQSPHGSNPGGYGEGIRLDVMHPSAKNLIVWRMPATNPALPFNATTNPVRDVAWMGAHWWHAEDNTAIHAHWSIEAPDANMALQTRLEMKIADFSTGSNPTTLGVNHTNILTNMADLTVRSDTSGLDTTPGVLRLAGTSNPKAMEFSTGLYGTGKLWRITTVPAADSGGSSTENLQVIAYPDGTTATPAMVIQRLSGRIALGESNPEPNARVALVYGAGDHGFMAKPSSSPGSNSGFAAFMTATGDRAMEARVASDSVSRLVVFADGRHEWGAGTAGRDTYLYRSAAAILNTDGCFKTGQNVTGSRPAAATVGKGAQFYDTTLNKPIWSDGANWKDASGATV